MLRPVPGRVQDGEDDVAELDPVAVRERLGIVLRLRGGMDPHRDAVLEREPAVAGDVVGVRVGLEHRREPHAVVRGRGQVLLDRERRVDDDRLAGLLVADEVGGAAEVLVDELLEQHEGTLTPGSARSHCSGRVSERGKLI